MKIIFTILLFSVSAYSFELLDAKKFQSLSSAQQVRYLNEIQKILVGITKQSPYTADRESTSNRIPANSKPNLDDWSMPGQSPTSVPSPFFNPKLSEEVKKTPDAAVTKKLTSPKKISTQKKQFTVQPVEKNKSSHFRCMHSGFVIEQDPCSGLQKIPDWIKIPGMTDKNKSCGPGLSVCNPVIFGLANLPMKCDSLLDPGCAEHAKPFCARRGLWPTEECHDMATAQGNRGTWFAAEISTKIQPELYTKYQEQMKELCDPEKIKTNPFAEYKNGVKRSDKTAQAVRDDIAKTCEWAEKQVSLLNEAVVDQTSSGNFLKPEKTAGQK